MLSSASDKRKLFAKSFSKNFNLEDSGIPLGILLLTSKINKKVIMNLDSSKASGPDCISVVVLKNCEFELSYKLAELFNMYLKESCSPDC